VPTVCLQGARLRRSNFGRIWAKTCAKVGVSGVHFHDLRHTGGTLAAATGASLKELMARLGPPARERSKTRSGRALYAGSGTAASGARQCRERITSFEGLRANRTWSQCRPAPGIPLLQAAMA
jgi:hypothetical protein